VRTLVAIATFALSLVLVGAGHAAPPHTITWTPKSGAPGAVVNLAGQPFVIARTPIKDLGPAQGEYQLTFLAARNAGAVFATVTTVHSKDALQNPVQIDGFDATVSVTDGRTYQIVSDFITPGTFNFTVVATAACVASIKVGQTLITVTGVLSQTQQPETNIGNKPNAIPDADWSAYTHPTSLVTGCNNFIDYIRIQQLP
jgi:hypothetical protein